MASPPKTIELKVIAIGNSRGIRLPKQILDRYAITETLVLEAREEGLVFRNRRDKRLSWDATYRDMARDRENWTDFDATIADGLDPRDKW
jgi:antitoxin MazE